ncbi:MAG: hypothetical protein GF346_02265 [Candidatus Eisenbacteria bacterium]|nr:hypothetical protein [Candidatus Latescibacterota bacterium]MBD3301252.1 hypothetical protein [Candidatus Eisenbacteria bacterium]
MSGPPEEPDRIDPRRVEQVGRALLTRRIDDARSAVITTGRFTDLFAAWEAHAVVWQTARDPFSHSCMRQGLAAAALDLANRPRDEEIAWTLHFERPPTNVFLTGEARAGIVTGRVYTDGVRADASSRLYVTSRRSGGPQTTSSIDVDRFDLLEIFEIYYRRSEQRPARFLELEEDRFSLFLSLPGGDPSWFETLGAEEAASRVDAGRLLEERPFRFECGCNPRRMVVALRDLFEEEPESLFEGNEEVETFCPRCGRRWTITREAFDAGGPTGERS